MKMAMRCGAYIEFSSHHHMHSYVFFPLFTYPLHMQFAVRTIIELYI